MVSELTVIVKNEEKNLRVKYLLYESYQVDEDDPIIKDCVEKTIASFDGDPIDVRVSITMEIN